MDWGEGLWGIIPSGDGENFDMMGGDDQGCFDGRIEFGHLFHPLFESGLAFFFEHCGGDFEEVWNATGAEDSGEDFVVEILILIFNGGPDGFDLFGDRTSGESGRCEVDTAMEGGGGVFSDFDATESDFKLPWF